MTCCLCFNFFEALKEQEKGSTEIDLQFNAATILLNNDSSEMMVILTWICIMSIDKNAPHHDGSNTRSSSSCCYKKAPIFLSPCLLEKPLSSSCLFTTSFSNGSPLTKLHHLLIIKKIHSLHNWPPCCCSYLKSCLQSETCSKHVSCDPSSSLASLVVITLVMLLDNTLDCTAAAMKTNSLWTLIHQLLSEPLCPHVLLTRMMEKRGASKLCCVVAMQWDLL